MLSDIFSFSFTLLLPNWRLISIRIYSGIARFPATAWLSCSKNSQVVFECVCENWQFYYSTTLVQQETYNWCQKLCGICMTFWKYCIQNVGFCRKLSIFGLVFLHFMSLNHWNCVTEWIWHLIITETSSRKLQFLFSLNNCGLIFSLKTKLNGFLNEPTFSFSGRGNSWSLASVSITE